MLQDDVVKRVLASAMEEQFSKMRPATRYFFEHRRPEQDQPRTVTIHRWSLTDVVDSDNEAILHHLAIIAVKEVTNTAVKITGEIVFQSNHLLPHQPLWEDGLPLFAEAVANRFDVPGGNIWKSVGCPNDDVVGAARRLELLDEEYSGDERLQVFCAKPLERELIRAAAKAGIPCRVFGLFNYKDERSWVITRDLSPCSLFIGSPSFDLPVKGNKLIVGARFVAWVNNPRYAVRVIP